MEEALQRGLGGRSSGGGGDGALAGGAAAAAAQNGESPPARRPAGGGPACLPSSVSPQAVRFCAALRVFDSSLASPDRLFA